MMKKTVRVPFIKVCALTLFMFILSICHAQRIPNRPSPPRLVNDFTNTLTASQVNSLEYKLRNYNDTTSTQIAVVFVNDLQGTTAADFAYQIGEKWGVGTKENNGIVILVKPKNETKGEVFISVGYGLEQYVPDALAKRIIETQMIPAFRYNDYYGGVNNAIDSIIKLASGGFSSDNEDEDAASAALMIIIIGMIVMILYITLIGKASTTISSKSDNSSFWKTLFWLSLLNNSHRHHNHHNHWNDFSGGSRGFGGGGFGGFGGGSFGGGGAGGSW